MINNKVVTGVILIAGNSSRYGQNRNKNFEILNGKTVLEYSLEAFDEHPYVDEIIIVIKEDEEERVKQILSNKETNKRIITVAGGNSRKESVNNALKNTNSDIVIIHDGARPLIKQNYISNAIEAMSNFKGVTIGVKSKDTIKITDDNGIVINSTKRSNTWIIQTPQCFDRAILLNLHEKYKNEDVTDDCMLLEKDGYEVKIIEGDYTNIKITTFEDINIVSEFLKSNK